MRDSALRELESRAAAQDARAKTELAETQAAAITEAALLKLELEDGKQALGRVRAQYDDAQAERDKEAARLRVRG